MGEGVEWGVEMGRSNSLTRSPTLPLVHFTRAYFPAPRRKCSFWSPVR
jgi:hypothetical protein